MSTVLVAALAMSTTATAGSTTQVEHELADLADASEQPIVFAAASKDAFVVAKRITANLGDRAVVLSRVGLAGEPEAELRVAMQRVGASCGLLLRGSGRDWWLKRLGDCPEAEVQARPGSPETPAAGDDGDLPRVFVEFSRIQVGLGKYGTLAASSGASLRLGQHVSVGGRLDLASLQGLFIGGLSIDGDLWPLGTPARGLRLGGTLGVVQAGDSSSGLGGLLFGLRLGGRYTFDPPVFLGTWLEGQWVHYEGAYEYPLLPNWGLEIGAAF